MGGNDGFGYTPNPDFDTPEKQAAFYAENPNMANITGIGRTLAGREETSTGNMLQGFITPNATVVQIYSYDNSYPGASGRTLHVNGTYEIA
jgi:hypothetical protein